MKKLLIVSAVCISTITLFSFKSKNDALMIMEQSARYSVDMGFAHDFVTFYEEFEMAGFELEPLEIAGWARAAYRYGKAAWHATGKQAFRRLMQEAAQAVPPFLTEGKYGFTAEDLAEAEEIGLIYRL